MVILKWSTYCEFSWAFDHFNNNNNGMASGTIAQTQLLSAAHNNTQKIYGNTKKFVQFFWAKFSAMRWPSVRDELRARMPRRLKQILRDRQKLNEVESRYTLLCTL